MCMYREIEELNLSRQKCVHLLRCIVFVYSKDCVHIFVELIPVKSIGAILLSVSSSWDNS